MKQFETLLAAAEYATTIAGRWQLADSDELYGKKSLPEMAAISDAENSLDEDNFYLVSPGGAIGLCIDDDKIDWWFLPLEGIEEDLPCFLSEMEKR